MSFQARLRQVLAGRALNPWLRRLGSNPGTADRITKGHIPGPDLLAVMHLVEGVSIDWLLSGKGTPFSLWRGPDAECSDRLVTLLADEPGAWTVHWIADPAGAEGALVLRMPAHVETKALSVAYTATELLAGAGPRTWRALAAECRSERAAQCLQASLAATEVEQLARGLLGTWRLFGAAEHPGLLCAARPAAPSGHEPTGAELAADAAPPAYRAAAPLARNAARLSAAHRAALEATVRGLLRAEGEDWLD